MTHDIMEQYLSNHKNHIDMIIGQIVKPHTMMICGDEELIVHPIIGD